MTQLQALADQRASGALGEAQAEAIRLRTMAQSEQLFRQFDVLLTPTMPVTAPAVGVDVPPGHEGRNAVDWSYFTYPFNLSGHPAASFPVARDAQGMPIGLQLVAGLDGEPAILRVAAVLERMRPVSVAGYGRRDPRRRRSPAAGA